MPQIIYSLISQFLVIPHFLLLWNFMHALNLSMKTLPFCTSNPFASLFVLSAKNITNDLFFLCNSLSWIATHCHNSFMCRGHAHKSQNKLQPFIEEWLVPLAWGIQICAAPFLCVACVSKAKIHRAKPEQPQTPATMREWWHTWGSEHSSDQKLCKAHLPCAPVASCVLTEFLAGAPWGMDLPRKVSPW